MTVIAKTRVRAVAATAIGVAFALLCVSAHGQGRDGGYFVPGDPKLGMRVFSDKGCMRCHSVLGEGGRSAPDLAKAPTSHLGSSELLAAMWNHAPSMWEMMRAEGVAPPRFSDAEMANLFAFLYSVRSLDEPGSAERGKQLMSEKKCLQCHTLTSGGNSGAPGLSKWAAYRNPVSWVQAMWNHAPAMQSLMAARGLQWPQFKDTDVSDIMAYIRVLSPGTTDHLYLRPADPQAGQQLFRTKSCANCHSLGAHGTARAPDLRSPSLPRSLGQFAAGMWNHAPAMNAKMQAQHIARPQFTNKEMADLLAYLFAERYFEGAGNSKRGARLFDEKSCAGCHRAGGTGPDLRGVSPSAAHLAASLWNHGPLMFQTMRQQQITWPRFQAGEIADIIEFLGSRPAPAAQRAGARP